MCLASGLFCAIVLTVLVFLWFKKPNKHKAFDKTLSGPPTIPILGNALDFKSTTDTIPTLQRYTKEYGEICKIEIGPFTKTIVVSDYNFLEAVLSSTQLLKKAEDYRLLHSWLGTGLLTSEGRKWKTHRRILTPAFHFQILEQFIEVFESCGSVLIQKLEGEVGNNSVDIYPLVTLYALDTICESVMGTRVNAQSNGDSDYVHSVKEMGRIVMERVFSPIQMYDLLYPLTKNYYSERKSLKIVHAHTNSVIMKRKEELTMGNTNSESAQNEYIKKKKPFLDLLLTATVDGRPLTNEEIREEVDTFMFEERYGHDTTASAISFTLFCLANHPEVQKKVLEEQQHLFADQEQPSVTLRDLQNMKYLEQVIKESMRLYPPVPLFSRKSEANVDFNEMPLPKNYTIMVFAYGIHRNPKYFENPDEFNPSRFDDIDGKLPYAYIPFSAGPRNCIGQKFAMLEIKSIISKIIRNYELKPATPKHELVLACETILKSSNGIKISIHNRS